LNTAIYAVANSEFCTLAPEKVGKAAFRKLFSYPKKISENLHRSRAILPHCCAHLLHLCPALIAPVVTAAYMQDIDSLKAVRSMKDFDSPTVEMTVTFTKTLYAQVSSFNLKSLNDYRFPADAESRMNEYVLGAKIETGFKIFLHSVKSQKVIFAYLASFRGLGQIYK
jgi:hypothetical protein